MHDYSVLFPQEYRNKKLTEKEQLDFVWGILRRGLSPIVTVLCLMAFLSASRR